MTPCNFQAGCTRSHGCTNTVHPWVLRQGSHFWSPVEAELTYGKEEESQCQSPRHDLGD